jgi:hypothetical protein
MSPVGFEPTIPAFERAKTLYALDLTATVIGLQRIYLPYIFHAKTSRKAINIRESIYEPERK